MPTWILGPDPHFQSGSSQPKSTSRNHNKGVAQWLQTGSRSRNIGVVAALPGIRTRSGRMTMATDRQQVKEHMGGHWALTGNIGQRSRRINNERQ